MDLVTATELQVKVPPLNSLEDVVGNSPLLPLRRLGSGLTPAVQLYAKAEWFNPGGSVKDRPALNILRAALTSGALGPGKRLLDSHLGWGGRQAGPVKAFVINIISKIILGQINTQPAQDFFRWNLVQHSFRPGSRATSGRASA